MTGGKEQGDQRVAPVASGDDAGTPESAELQAISYRHPNAKRVQAVTSSFTNRNGALWEIDSDPRTGTRKEMQFFVRYYGKEERHVLVVREFGRRGIFESTETPATLIEMVDFAFRADADIPGEPVVAEMLEFVNNEIDEAKSRLAHLAVTQSQL